MITYSVPEVQQVADVAEVVLGLGGTGGDAVSQISIGEQEFEQD